MKYCWMILAVIVFGSIGGLLYLKHHKSKTCLDDATIIVGTNAEYQPFSWVKDGEIVGLDIDIIKEVGKRLNKKIKIVDMSFTMLIPEIQTGRIQVIAAGLTPTAERAKQLRFTKPYITGDPLVIITMANKQPITNVQELTGKTVVVNEGYTADFWASSQSGFSLYRVDNPAMALLALGNGRADAFVAASSSVKPFFDQYGKEQYQIHSLDGVGDQYALAISKACPKLYDEIETVMAQMVQDGTMAALKKKWGFND